MITVEDSQGRHKNDEVFLWFRVNPQAQLVDKMLTVVQIRSLIVKELAQREPQLAKPDGRMPQHAAKASGRSQVAPSRERKAT